MKRAKRSYVAKPLRLSNYELERALTFISGVLAQIGASSARYLDSAAHYKALLVEQQRRTESRV